MPGASRLRTRPSATGSMLPAPSPRRARDRRACGTPGPEDQAGAIRTLLLPRSLRCTSWLKTVQRGWNVTSRGHGLSGLSSMEPNRLFILGATGRTGRELVDIALTRGHQVTAFVRSPAKVTRRDPRLTVVKGDPRNADELSRAMPGHDAVLSALGPLPREAMTRTTLLEESASSAMTALLRSGVRRFLVVSSAMLFPGGGPVAALLRLMLRPHVRDLKAMEERVSAAAIEWTIARPPRLVA